MGVYIVLLLACLLASSSSKHSIIGGLLIITFLFFISAGRGEGVGIDTINYYNNVFNSIEGENHSFEVLFMWISGFIRENSLNPRWCIYVLSFVTFFFLYVSARRYKVRLVYVCLFYLLFNLYAHSFNIARQMTACSILLYAYSFLLVDSGDKCHNSIIVNVLKFFVFVLLAASFHIGAIIGVIGLLVYFFHIEKIGSNPILISLLLVVFFIIIQVFKGFLLSKSIGVLSSITVYDQLGSETKETSLSFLGLIYRSIGYVFHGTALCFLIKDSHYKLSRFYFISLIIKIILSAFYGNVLRLGLYFSIIDVIVFSKCCGNINERRSVFFLLVVVYFSIDYLLVLIGNTFETVPYVFNMIEI